MTLAEVTHALGATRVGANVRFTSVSTDSRTLEKDALFVALKGERFDGHDHVGASSARGAVAAMVERLGGGASDAAGLPLVVVGDTRVALGLLAKHWRSRFRIPAIAVVGSNGKTTVKEMTAAALRAHFGERQVLATAGNLNNDIGLPLTALRLAAEHACAVLELGMNHPGETAYLTGIARPTITLVNNAQREHQEFMQNVDEVAAEHAAAIRALPDDGVAVLNRDDPYFDYWAGIAGRRTVRSFGVNASADVRADYRLGATGSEPRDRGRRCASGTQVASTGNPQRPQCARRDCRGHCGRGDPCVMHTGASDLPGGEGTAATSARSRRRRLDRR